MQLKYSWCRSFVDDYVLIFEKCVPPHWQQTEWCFLCSRKAHRVEYTWNFLVAFVHQPVL